MGMRLPALRAPQGTLLSSTFLTRAGGDGDRDREGQEGNSDLPASAAASSRQAPWLGPKVFKRHKPRPPEAWLESGQLWWGPGCPLCQKMGTETCQEVDKDTTSTQPGEYYDPAVRQCRGRGHL